jgi:hypothetical protein
VVGLLFCFRGYLAMRVIIPIWGAFAGFFFGAGLVASLGGEGFLSTALGWIVGAVVAVVFGALAYLYYEVSVLLTMGAVGFALGTSAMVALGVTWSWVIILVGVISGALVAVLAIFADLPMILLSFLTALAGASTTVLGLMLLSGVVTVGDLESSSTTQRLQDDWWWYPIYLVLAIGGMIAQARSTRRLQGTLRDNWTETGGRQIRTA